MQTSLVNKRSQTVLGPIAANPVSPGNAITSCISLSSDQQENIVVGPDVFKIRHAGSRVWSDIRGALKTKGRASQIGSEAPAMNDIVAEEVTLSPSGKLSLEDNPHEYVEGLSGLQKKAKGSNTRDLVRKLKHLGLTSNNNTVILRRSEGKRRNSVQGLIQAQASPSSDNGVLPLTRQNPADDDTARRTSIDSRVSVVTRDASRRKESRRTQVLTKSILEYPLGTIQESGTDHPCPTILTVEKAAAAKVYLETHFNEKLYQYDTRGIRRQYLESQLFYSPHLTEDQKNAVRASYCSQETCHLRETRVLISRSQAAGRDRAITPYTDNYESLKILGKGSFGVVRLVQEKSQDEKSEPKQVFAMKVIRKSDMLRSSQEGHLRAERDFLVASEGAHWAVALVCSFQDASNLYLVMDYMPGGDFLGLLIRENILPEAAARFYIAEMILAVEEAHRLKFIHRDIKPDNFLISASGHLKISDFGLAFDGHWSHDVSYYNYQRNSLIAKLGIQIRGDEIDQKDNRDINKQIEATRVMMAGVERHGNQDKEVDENLENLLGWRNRCGNRTSAHSIVGTSQYMAPEVIQGQAYDGRCDW